MSVDTANVSKFDATAFNFQFHFL